MATMSKHNNKKESAETYVLATSWDEIKENLRLCEMNEYFKTPVAPEHTDTAPEHTDTDTARMEFRKCAIEENNDFKLFSKTQYSGMCFLDGSCYLEEHNLGCDIMTAAAMEAFELTQDHISKRDLCIMDLALQSVSGGWFNVHPALITTAISKLLLQVLQDKTGVPENFKILDTKTVEASKQEKYYFAFSLCNLHILVKHFRKNFPHKHMIILIYRMPYTYPWIEDLANLINVLSQSTRVSRMMTKQVKVIVSGSGIFRKRESKSDPKLLWDWLVEKKEKEGRDKPLSSESSVTNISVLHERDLALRWNEKEKCFYKINPDFTAD